MTWDQMDSPSAIFMPDGKLLCNIGKSVEIWDIQHKKCRLLKRLTTDIELSAWDVSADGKYLVVIDRLEKLTVWDLHTLTIIKRLTLPDYCGDTIAFSPQGHVLALAQPRKTRGNAQYDVHLIDVRHWRRCGYLYSTEEVSPLELAWSHDGRFLAANTFYGDAGIGTLSVWKLKGSKTVYHYEGGGDENAFYNIGSGPLCFIGRTHRLVCGQDWIDLNRRNPTPHHVIRHSDGYHQHCIRSFGAKQNFILTDRYVESSGNTIGFKDPYQVWDPLQQHWVAKFYSPHKHDLIIAVSPDSRYLVSVDGDDTPPPNGKAMRLYALSSQSR